MRKLKFKSGKIEIDIDDTKTKLRLQTTGKTTVGSSDGKTTAMQERASLVVIQDAIQNRKTYTNVVKFMASTIFKKVVEVYPDVNETWCAGLLAQAKKMKTEFTGLQDSILTIVMVVLWIGYLVISRLSMVSVQKIHGIL